MTSDNNIFTLRFFENSITPSSFTAKELGQLVIAFHEGLKSLIEERYPTINSEDVRISLVGIQNQSNSLNFSTSEQQEVGEAIEELGTVVSKNQYTDLPKAAYNSIKLIHGIAKRKQCKAELVKKGKRLFVVAAEDEFIEQSKVLIKSNMVLYGELNQIRGNKPKAWVELYDGSKVSFSITDTQVIQLREKVKEAIAIKGEAKWNTISKKVVSFKLVEVLGYQSGNASKGFDEIRKSSSGFWDTLNTNQEIIHHLKGDA